MTAATRDGQPTRGESVRVGPITFSFLTVVLLILHCGPERSTSIEDRLQRSEARVWERRQSAILNITIEVPRDLCGFSDTPGIGLVVSLHALRRRVGGLDDKRCLMQLVAQRLNKQRFEDDAVQHGEQVAGGSPNANYWRWQYQPHLALSRFDEHAFTYYRYDLRCPDEDVITSHVTVAKVYKNGTSLYGKADEELVRRMISSLRCGPAAGE